MGIIYNPYVEEKKLYEAYDLTVYGKVNRYEWTIYADRPTENCYITLRIADANGNNIIDVNMGNNAIMERNFNDTIDNFLYWIISENPEISQIEEQIYRSLCQTDSIFNHLMANRKMRDRREAEERKRAEERKEMERAVVSQLEEYCKENGFFFHIDDIVTIVKALTNNSRSLLAEAQRNRNAEKMKQYIDFMEKYPENHDAKIVKRGSMEEMLKWIK